MPKLEKVSDQTLEIRKAAIEAEQKKEETRERWAKIS